MPTLAAGSRVRAFATIGAALLGACGGEATPPREPAGAGGSQAASSGASGSAVTAGTGGTPPAGGAGAAGAGKAGSASGSGGSASGSGGSASGSAGAAQAGGAGTGAASAGGRAGEAGAASGSAGTDGGAGGTQPAAGSAGAGGANAGGSSGSSALSFEADIWPMFTEVRDPVFVYLDGSTYESCVTGGVCHGGPVPGARMSMPDAATAYEMLLDVPSRSELCAGTIRVVAGNPDESCLILFYEGRLRDELAWVDQAEIERVREWIREGAAP
jgi:hypothetical protein